MTALVAKTETSPSLESLPATAIATALKVITNMAIILVVVFI
jgi:hypothetical protein